MYFEDVQIQVEKEVTRQRFNVSSNPHPSQSRSQSSHGVSKSSPATPTIQFRLDPDGTVQVEGLGEIKANELELMLRLIDQSHMNMKNYRPPKPSFADRVASWDGFWEGAIVFFLIVFGAVGIVYAIAASNSPQLPQQTYLRR